ncbi:MAG TPA: glycosyltransferase family 4 protein [Bacteroidia bacterium]|nr:glycosyltransferase family 4 protein [Bacteroidia bacterium]
MRKKKVLILGKLPPPYMGPAIATEIILNSSLNRKYELLHLHTGTNTSLTSIGKWSLAKVFRTIRIYLNMFRISVFHKPDLVLIPFSQSTLGFMKDFFFIAIARLCGRKVLLQLRGSNFQNWLQGRSPFLKRFVIWSLRLSRGVIVLGNNLKPLFRGIFEEKKVFVVPNGGNYDLSFRVKRNDILRVLYLGNLQSSKGIEDVIDAVSLLTEKFAGKFAVDVVGNWREDKIRELCMKRVEEKKLPVRFHPPASGKDKLKFLSDADILVFTPRAPEGHPWVIVEAMAAGLPIISTDRGAIVESVRDEENGFIVKAGSPSDIAAKLELLLSDELLRERMGASGRKKYEENFTEEKMVQNLSLAFESAIDSGK